jgi:hypothetical protein
MGAAESVKLFAYSSKVEVVRRVKPHEDLD